MRKLKVTLGLSAGGAIVGGATGALAFLLVALAPCAALPAVERCFTKSEKE
jgi:hypothetical protein